MWILQRYHYVREMSAENQIHVMHVGTALNLADLFTKGVSKEVQKALTPILYGL